MPSAPAERRPPRAGGPDASAVVRALARFTTRLSLEGTVEKIWGQVGPDLAGSLGVDHLVLALRDSGGRLVPLVPDQPRRHLPRSAARLLERASRIGAGCVTGQVPMAIAAPLDGQGRPAGALYAGLERGRGWSPDVDRLIRECAGFLGVALETRRLALLDGVTGVYNHRHFQVLLGLEIDRSLRFGKPFTLLMSDLDGFKAINDRHGHLAGDRLLRVVAETLRSSVRSVDLVARYGGEEFAVILPGTSAVRGRKVAEKLRRAIGRLRPRTASGARLRITLSLGVAGFPRHARDRATLIAAADAALYRAKGQGRNRVVAASVSPGALRGADRERRALLRSGAGRRSRPA